ncbi:MAG: ABC transporter substrate-binding protein [Paludibacterium sp.]|uniref:heme/hemin ABC transporter substrate-binding protein n=1 Tax=Paludibacterium sp. TaxID=1917523 RepID=UPI0025F0A804|nr:ABC transporter substrate-binding protein [Paludibacterium sp.]MBV8045935.1 ABC transporter substrate-binding protein [Paludibacterium sp.]MBV8647881.1 ABC transporter substrate-binding protein [Paludibacterium sp.]
MPSLTPLRRTLLKSMAAFGVGLCVPRAGAAGAPRLICVGGALTEIVYALGGERLLVGVDTTSRYPAAAQKLPSVGYARTLSAEGLLSLAPTAVLASEDAGPPAVLRTVAAAGVPVHVLAANHRYEGLLSRVAQVGRLTGLDAPAARLAATLSRDWQALQARLAQTPPPPRVLFILATTPGQWLVAGGDTAADAMLRYAGAVNALSGFNGYKPLSAEAVVAARPDALLLTDQGLAAAGGIDGILHLPGVAQTPAGKKRRVLAQDALQLLGFGPRLPQAVAQLAERLRAEPPA